MADDTISRQICRH